jgi:hypothetical protein
MLAILLRLPLRCQRGLRGLLPQPLEQRYSPSAPIVLMLDSSPTGRNQNGVDREFFTSSSGMRLCARSTAQS